jgi:hypothetical protein
MILETNFYIDSARTPLSQTSHQNLYLHPPYDVLHTEQFATNVVWIWEVKVLSSYKEYML